MSLLTDSYQGKLQRGNDTNKLMESWNAVTIISAETHYPCVVCSLVLSPLLFRSTLKGVQGDLEMSREYVLTFGLNTWTAESRWNWAESKAS